MHFIFDSLLLATVLVLFIIHWFFKPDRHLPPSPRRPLPFLGHLLYLDKGMRVPIRKWREQCGDIFSIYVGSKLLVVISGYDLIKETLIKRGHLFVDRPVMHIDEIVNFQGKGIALSSGPVWKEHRSFALNILRKFGLGQNILAERIQEEVQYYLDYLLTLGGQPVDIRNITTSSIGNIICAILIGQRFHYNDPIFQKLINEVHELVVSNQLTATLIVLPILKYLPGNRFNENKLKRNLTEIYAIFQSFIDTSKDKDSKDHFIAAYMAEKESRIQNGEDTTMDNTNLLKCVFDLFIAGTETTSTTLRWFVLYMLHYPDVQRKIYDEIDEHVGTYRTPNIEDKATLVYLNAAIMEAQRLASILPQSVARQCTKDIIVRNFTIPKGSMIAPNLDSVLWDEEIWGSDSQSYRPERFIDEKGQLKNPEEFIPFGVGRRLCLGESMAKMELFLYLSSMIQKFEILPVNPKELPQLSYVFGFACIPSPYQVKLIQRKNN